MQKIKTEWNDFTGALETYYWDDVAQKVIIKNTFNVTSVLESNKRIKNTTIDSRFGNKMMHHVAEIPNVFIHKFKTEHNLDVFSKDPAEQLRLRRLLESPEYAFLKTTVKKLWRPVSKRKGDK
jgi:hypothetical protein